MTSPHYWAASPPTALAHSECCDEGKGQNSRFGQIDVIQVSLEEEVAGPACGCCLRSLGTEGGAGAKPVVLAHMSVCSGP